MPMPIKLMIAAKDKQSEKLATGTFFCIVMPMFTSPELPKQLFVSASLSS